MRTNFDVTCHNCDSEDVVEVMNSLYRCLDCGTHFEDDEDSLAGARERRHKPKIPKLKENEGW